MRRVRAADDIPTSQTIKEDGIRFSKSISILAVTAGLAAVAAPAAAGQDDATVTICNEAENSHRGGYTVSGGIVDPNPPAFLRGSQMRVGDGDGLLNAAQHSPALRECGRTGDDDGGGGQDYE